MSCVPVNRDGRQGENTRVHTQILKQGTQIQTQIHIPVYIWDNSVFLLLENCFFLSKTIRIAHKVNISFEQNFQNAACSQQMANVPKIFEEAKVL